jgi:carbonic anhydrase
LENNPSHRRKGREQDMTTISPHLALQELLAGNARFVGAQLTHPNQNADHRRALTGGQHPFVAVLSCSDSRVPPEIVFDRGLGDIFVVRVAGNIVDDIVAASLEYAAEHLRVPLVVVLGHESCGAVTAALQGGHAAGRIPQLIEALRPAVMQAAKEPGDSLHNTIVTNVQLMVDQLRTTGSVLPELLAGGKLAIVGAIYDLATGKVALLP